MSEGFCPLARYEDWKHPQAKRGTRENRVVGLQSEFQDLVQVATELSEKHSWIRTSFEKFMQELWRKIAKNTDYDREFRVEYLTVTDDDGNIKTYYFILGDREISIMAGWEYPSYLVYRVEKSFAGNIDCVVIDRIHVREIREFLSAFPKIVENLKKQMEKELDKTAQAIDTLNKILEVVQ